MPQANLTVIPLNEQNNGCLANNPTADQWEHKTGDLVDAILCILSCKTVSGELDVTISISLIHHYLALQNLVQLYIEGREGKIPELAFLPIKAYFETGLPGFNPSLAHDPTQWDPEVFNQHGYLTGQFSRTLAMMMPTNRTYH